MSPCPRFADRRRRTPRGFASCTARLRPRNAGRRPGAPLLSGRPGRRRALLLAAVVLATACAPRLAPTGDAPPRRVPGDAPPRLVPGTAWRAEPPLGHHADAARRNLRPGESFTFRELTVSLVGVTDADGTEAARLRLVAGGARTEPEVREGAAIRWGDFRIAVVAIHGEGELGAGFTALEVATLASLPAALAADPAAGAAAARLRIPHEITHVTLHHTGSVQPLRPEDDPARVLRGLQAWGARDRNWWDVPYHFLIDLDGRVYEGRDWRYQGETNTDYDPAGHFLISVIGNYELQPPTRAQLDAIADMMAWALARFDLPVDRIGGHYHYADTSCPGRHLRAYLEDGTLQRMAEARLPQRRP